MEHTVKSPDTASPRYRRFQEAPGDGDCEYEAATVEQADSAWRREEEHFPPGGSHRERFRDALLAAIADGWIAVYPPIKAGRSWTINVLR
jgi:hypothetical protein